MSNSQRSVIPCSVLGSTGSVDLIGAILLYGSDRQSPSASCFATLHSVGQGPGSNDGSRVAGQILPGRLMQRGDLDELVKGLSNADATLSAQWLDPRVLAMGGGRLLWWSPPGRRPMFFQVAERFAESKVALNDQGVVPVPGLVWLLMDDTLYVWATKSQDRPGVDDVLYQAPLLNVWSQGKICQGSSLLPDASRRHDPQAWMDAFWASRFTHPNSTEADRLILGQCPVEFWRDMLKAKRKTFPLDRLVALPSNLKAGDLVAPDLTRRLNETGRARGE